MKTIFRWGQGKQERHKRTETSPRHPTQCTYISLLHSTKTMHIYFRMSVTCFSPVCGIITTYSVMPKELFHYFRPDGYKGHISCMNVTLSVTVNQQLLIDGLDQLLPISHRQLVAPPTIGYIPNLTTRIVAGTTSCEMDAVLFAAGNETRQMKRTIGSLFKVGNHQPQHQYARNSDSNELSIELGQQFKRQRPAHLRDQLAATISLYIYLKARYIGIILLPVPYPRRYWVFKLFKDPNYITSHYSDRPKLK